MDFYSVVEGPLLWISFIVLFLAVIIRIIFFFSAILKRALEKESGWKFGLASLGRFLLPFHSGFVKRPFYASLRYIFHFFLFVVPIWLAGHISLWEESRFEWSWISLPDAWADWMTLILLGIGVFFLFRHVLSREVRSNSSISDYVLIILATLPFMTGYFLTHGTVDSIAFLSDNIMTFHILSGEAMMIMVAFLFCRTQLNTQKCIACAACEINCPTETLETRDEAQHRIFTYSHYQCICCGACVATCPENAAELRHEISARRFFQIRSKHEIRIEELMACERCGARFVPEPQFDKIGQDFDNDYLRFCPRCRKVNIGNFYRRLFLWQKSGEKGGETSSVAHVQ